MKEADALLINAGAGSGKTLTMIGKILYLIKCCNISPASILCISFTNATTKSLEEKIAKYYDYQIEVKTFHKLSLDIISHYLPNPLIANDNFLSYIIDEFLSSSLKQYPKLNKFLKNYLQKTSYQELKKLITSFIHRFKANAYETKDFAHIFSRNLSYTNHQLLKIILLIYQTYQEELQSSNRLDFNDMINLATKLVQKEYRYHHYKYIIIDEYQDTSFTRFSLIKAIVDKTSAKLLVVGDDFQSIYRFTGCNLDLFLNFTKLFPNATTTHITNTYRNPQELIDVAGSFVMKNPHQIKKTLKSSKHLSKPIKIVYTKRLIHTMLEIITHHQQEEIFIIGRNNDDIIPYLNNDIKMSEDGSITITNFPNAKIKYLTAHKSKGLESEIVILINLTNKINGFPNNFPTDKLLKLLDNSQQSYPFDEERRLFYVALTRTKTICYLIVNKKEQSIFVKELIKNYPHQIATISSPKN